LLRRQLNIQMSISTLNTLLLDMVFRANNTTRYIMNCQVLKNVCSIAVTCSLVSIAGAFSAEASAQSNQPVTRAQVKAELVQLENAGYHPNEKDNYYPSKLQAAEAKIAQQGADRSGYGSNPTYATQSGSVEAPAAAYPGAKPLYFGH